MKKSTKLFTLLLATAFALITGQTALACLIGAGPPLQPIEKDHPPTIPPIDIQGDEASVFLGPISYDPCAGPIYKLFTGAQGPSIHIVEDMEVGPGPVWTDWHEIILTPGWEWAFASAPIPPTLDSPSIGPIPGVPGGGGVEVNFYFPAIPCGEQIHIEKYLVWTGLDVTGAPVVFTPDILVAEYPTTVPVPGAVWLLGSGLMGLVGLRKKLKK